MADDAVEIDFKLETNDIVSYFAFAQLHCIGQDPNDRNFFYWLKVFMWGVLPIFLFSFLAVLAEKFGIPSFLVNAIVLLSLFALVYKCKDFHRKNIENNSKKINAQNYLLQSSYFISPESVLIKNEAADIRFKWSYVQGIKLDKSSFYIFFNTVGAVIVPRHAFESDADFQAFYNKCLGYYEAAKSKAETGEVNG